MTSIEPGLYLRINELEDGPNPLPLRNGFTASDAYSAQGLFNPSEFAESHPAIHTWPEEKFVTIADCSDMQDNTHKALKRYGSLNAYSNPCKSIWDMRHVVSVMANTVCESKEATRRLHEVLHAGFSYTIAASRLLFSHQSTAHLNPGGLLSFQVASPFAQSPRGINTVTASGQVCGVVRPLLVSISPSGGQ